MYQLKIRKLKNISMTPTQIKIVKSTWDLVTVLDPVVVGSIFYNRLFEIAPNLRSLFTSSQNEQSKKLVMMLNYIISKLDSLDDIIDEVTRLAERHVDYGVHASDYVPVGEALLWTLERALGPNWNKEVKYAWEKCYNILSVAMIDASGYNRSQVA
jgi:hemoglobin-like flavoprotein